MYSTPYSATPRAVDSDYVDYGAHAELRELHIEVLGLDEPEDYEPTERDYKHLDA